LDNIAQYNVNAKSENDMDEDDPTPSEDERQQVIEFFGTTIGEAYLEKEHRKSRVVNLLESTK
jgi:hypothetical protein